MANTLASKIELKTLVTLTKNGPPLDVMARIQAGAGTFDSLLRELSNGTGTGSANEVVYTQQTITATTTASLDLAGGLTNPHGETVTFTALKCWIVAIDSPDGTKSVRVGPQNVSNAWGTSGPWGGSGATVYLTTRDIAYWYDPYAGYSVTAGTGDIFPLHNPGASSITVHVVLIGTK